MAEILIVDDERDMLELLHDLLVLRFSHHVIEASSGAEAVEILKKQHVDLLITDYVMARGDGKFILSNLRHTKPKLPIIIVTGFEIVETTLLVAFESISVLRKPIEPERLYALVQAYLKPPPGSSPSHPFRH
jgi:DNA-binding NtrC family response regulator